MANHRSAGRATVRKHRAVGGTHRDSALSTGAVKVGVLGVLATATIAAPLAAAAAGVDESMPQGETVAQAAPAAPAPQAPAPVALPAAQAEQAEQEGAESAATEARTDDGANRSQEREEAPADAGTDDSAAAQDSEQESSAEEQGTGIEVAVAEPEPEPAEVAAGEAEAAGGSASGSGYLRPVSGPITSGYGGRMHPVLGYFKGHNGVDFGAACGTPVQAAKGGTVTAVEYHHASGNRVKIDHGNGVVTGYYHLQGFNTSVGATVSAGDVIGYAGSTGRSTGCHLHFAKMDEAGNYSNPMSLLR